MQHPEVVQHIVDQLTHVEGIKAIVLGGSWATGAQRPDSDIDLGLFYSEASPLDIPHIRKIAIKLNDFPDPIVTDLGEWGKWVNGGAWLTIKGRRVDFLYRNIDFVSNILDDCIAGKIQLDGPQQPPYGFHSYIYCAEVKICKVFYDPNGVLQKLKSKVRPYPQLLKSRIINGFTWDAEFTLEVAKKPAARGDVYFVAGCLTRIASDLVQVLYALNETYFISDKRMYRDEHIFKIKPDNFSERIETILGNIGRDSNKLKAITSGTETLLKEVIALCGEQYTPKFVKSF